MLYLCGKTNHLAKYFRQHTSESNPTEDKRQRKGKETTAVAKVIKSINEPEEPLILWTFLCSNSDSEGSNNVVRITDKGVNLGK